MVKSLMTFSIPCWRTARGTSPPSQQQIALQRWSKLASQIPAILFTKESCVDINQVGAATDGLAQSLSMTMYFLLRHPHTMTKLREEVDSALSPDDAVAPWEKVKSLPYLRACLDEAMRLTPPVATELIRCTPPDASVVTRPCSKTPRRTIRIGGWPRGLIASRQCSLPSCRSPLAHALVLAEIFPCRCKMFVLLLWSIITTLHYLTKRRRWSLRSGSTFGR